MRGNPTKRPFHPFEKSPFPSLIPYVEYAPLAIYPHGNPAATGGPGRIERSVGRRILHIIEMLLAKQFPKTERKDKQIPQGDSPVHSHIDTAETRAVFLNERLGHLAYQRHLVALRHKSLHCRDDKGFHRRLNRRDDAHFLPHDLFSSRPLFVERSPHIRAIIRTVAPEQHLEYFQKDSHIPSQR